ncbi:hypothetical protein LFT51_02065 [Mycobacterium intracellulare subsp. chimaera]|uniref:Type II toxin-antitoxin system RelE/ParE family toxin n=1 Tax=Mycobacterium timonense TaxID=701043 RepID=A0A7I9ZE93_9MYCO|nr:hypothetical protein [Mycobacterium intracellulare]ETZ38578.1 hypothetical protein L842_5946 [Mycobacterium intracellulare MIN_052511_1280]MCA2249065.1 hypothetical protein [Mycobacterium intracellulare]UCN04445.1 hypothetical protein LFT51_02065 [Mycobacterium intracellulare subsp. chimaera]GFG99096.1 hypothetical protein MTIM_49750 [Mycobacterium timonense]
MTVRNGLAREPRRAAKPFRSELTAYHSARRGPYRLLYRIDDDAVRSH